jgi:hypothetical protein
LAACARTISLVPYRPIKSDKKTSSDECSLHSEEEGIKNLEIKGDVVYTSGSNKLKGWKRFLMKQDANDEEKQVIQPYQRWWANVNPHIHLLLLWL